MNRNAILTVWPFEAFVCIYVSFFPTYFFALLRVDQINFCEDFCVHKLLGRREVSEYAVSRRRRQSHSSAGPAPELFTLCVHFSKYSRDLDAKFFSRKRDALGMFGGSHCCSLRGRLSFAEGKAEALSVLCAHSSPRGFE